MHDQIDQHVRGSDASKRIARLAGAFYLVVALCALFAQFYARGTVYVPGNAAATADNIVAHADLFRVGFVADLVTATSFMFVGMALYKLLRHVNKEFAAALMVFVTIGTAMFLVNLLNHFASLMVATDASFTSALGPEGSDALALLFLDLHQYGYTMGGILFGLWLLPLGYLAYASGMFPKALGVALIIACFCYVIDTLMVFLLPDLGPAVSTIVTAPSAVAEFWMVGYLLFVGIRTPKATSRIAVAA